MIYGGGNTSHGFGQAHIVTGFNRLMKSIPSPHDNEISKDTIDKK